MDEIGTRLVPWEQSEFTHAHNRPRPERPPLPEPGDQVWYRRYDWHHNPATGETENPELVTVVEVQPPDDESLTCHLPGVGLVRDLNLWHLVRDNVTGRPAYDPSGQPRYVHVADPWPWLRLRRPNGMLAETREARLRGSAGWLPLDYRSRPERWRLPGQTLIVPRPALQPIAGPGPAPAPAPQGR
jgi:hypothetical protein